MNTSETPRTDEVEFTDGHASTIEPHVESDFARQLERELNAEIAARNGWWDNCKAAELERDQLRARVAELAKDKARLDWLDYVDGEKLNDKGDALQWGSRKKKKKSDFAEQAERTAWKIIQDWVEVQMSMIQTGQAETLQVFLPYVFDGKKTYYQALSESKFAGLLPEKTTP